MVDQTPIDTTPNTPLDALKGAYLRGHDRIATALDELIGTLGVDEDNSAIGMLDEADRALALLVCEALGYEKPDRRWMPSPANEPELYRYDNGMPVILGIHLGPAVVMDIWPRFDTKETVQATLGYSLDLVFPPAPAPQSKVQMHATATASIREAFQSLQGGAR